MSSETIFSDSCQPIAIQLVNYKDARNTVLKFWRMLHVSSRNSQFKQVSILNIKDATCREGKCLEPSKHPICIFHMGLEAHRTKENWPGILGAVSNSHNIHDEFDYRYPPVRYLDQGLPTNACRKMTCNEYNCIFYLMYIVHHRSLLNATSKEKWFTKHQGICINRAVHRHDQTIEHLQKINSFRWLKSTYYNLAELIRKRQTAEHRS